jgi:hypothetical protein
MHVDVAVESDGSAGDVKVLDSKGIPVSLSTCVTLLISAERYDSFAQPKRVMHVIIPVHFALPR